MSQPKFAAFDIDGTLVRWQFFHAVVHELGKAGLIEKTAHDRIRHARMHWKKREEPDGFRGYEHTLVDTYFEALQTINETDHTGAIDRVFEEYKDQLFTYTRDLLNDLKNQGYLIFAISGSHDTVLAKLADHIGIDDYIGAHFEFQNGRYTGSSSTPIHDKAAALRKLTDKHGVTYTDSVAIGDSESDSAMLALVEWPIAFNPSHGLLQHAREQGWDIVVERKNTIYELKNHDGTYILA